MNELSIHFLIILLSRGLKDLKEKLDLLAQPEALDKLDKEDHQEPEEMLVWQVQEDKWEKLVTEDETEKQVNQEVLEKQENQAIKDQEDQLDQMEHQD